MTDASNSVGVGKEHRAARVRENYDKSVDKQPWERHMDLFSGPLEELRPRPFHEANIQLPELEKTPGRDGEQPLADPSF